MIDPFTLKAHAGGKMKEVGTTYWNSPNTGATNESRFTGLPVRYHLHTGMFDGIGEEGWMWSSTESFTSNAFCYGLLNNYASAPDLSHPMRYGLSVRCVKK